MEIIRSDGYVNRWELVVAPTEYDEEGNVLPSRYVAECLQNAIPVTDPLAKEAAAKGLAIKNGAATPEEVETEAAKLLAEVKMPVPNSISLRQFFYALAILEIITYEEAEAAIIQRVLPAKIMDVIDLMPPPYDFDAKTFFGGATVFYRNHPFTSVFVQMAQLNDDIADEVWRVGAKLT